MKVIENLYKAELHVHVEGTIEYNMILNKAKKHNIHLLNFPTEQVFNNPNFKNLSDFLDLYTQSSNVLCDEEDFYDVTLAYLQQAKQNNIKHVELLFDPQAHIKRGISFNAVIAGIKQALTEGKNTLNISNKLIMGFLRDLGPQSAKETYIAAKKYLHLIDGIGLDSREVGFPPSLFKEVYQMAKSDGLFLTAHAGEEGDPSYVWEAIDILKVDRIDHGIRSIEDKKLMQELGDRQIPLTFCPLSNKMLKVCENLENYPLREFIKYNIPISINSDDPSFFGGHINNNYKALKESLQLSNLEIKQLGINAFKSSFLDNEEKNKYISVIENTI